MDTRKIEALLTSIEAGTFTKAAAQLGCTQSGLTHMMDSLEKEVGFPLLSRSRSGVQLTENGEALLPAMRELVKWSNQLNARIERISGRKSETVRIASYSSMSLHWLPLILKQLQADHPNINVEIVDGTVDDIFAWVRCGKVDLGFASRQPDMRCDWIPLREDPMVAILPMEFEVDDTQKLPVKFFDRKS